MWAWRQLIAQQRPRSATAIAEYQINCREIKGCHLSSSCSTSKSQSSRSSSSNCTRSRRLRKCAAYNYAATAIIFICLVLLLLMLWLMDVGTSNFPRILFRHPDHSDLSAINQRRDDKFLSICTRKSMQVGFTNYQLTNSQQTVIYLFPLHFQCQRQPKKWRCRDRLQTYRNGFCSRASIYQVRIEL